MKKYNYLRTTIYILVVVLLVLTVVNSIIINPGNRNNFQIQIDSPVETYTFNETSSFNRMTIASTYLVLNETGFNVTVTNPISIVIDNLDEDILSFTVNNTPGNVDFDISGFNPSTSYTLLIEGIYNSDIIASASGVFSFSDNPSTGTTYRIYLTVGGNTPPVQSNPVPGNASTGIALTPTCSIDISDTEGSPMSGGFLTNDSGEWLPFANFTDEPDSTISNASTGHFTTDYTKYWWCANITDGVLWTNRTYHFTTTGSGLPEVQTNNPTNIQGINVTLQGTLINDGGEDAWVRFEWGNITDPFGHISTNQTKNSGEDYTVSIRGNLSNWYNTDWTYRKQIDINYNHIDGELLNLPILINDTDSYYQYARDPDGYDFVFTTDDGVTQLNHEIERFTYANNELLAWVNVPTVYEDKDTTIWLYWGNLSSTDQSNPTGVWNSNYIAVYHLDEQSGTTVYDSTSNQYHANYSTPRPTRTGGKIGYGQFFTGVENISFPYPVYYPLMEDKGYYNMQVEHVPDLSGVFAPMTLINFRDTTGTNEIYSNTASRDVGLSTPQTRMYGVENGTNSWQPFTPDTDWNIGSIINTWCLHGQYWNVVTDKAYIIYDITPTGTLGDNDTGYGFPGGIYEFIYFGNRWNGANPFYGNVDEIRFYDMYINDTLLKAESYSMDSLDGFINYYSPETIYSDTGNVTAGTLYYYKAVTNNSIGSSNGEVIGFLTRPYAPTLFAALTENKSEINLTWIQLDGSGYNTTYIERTESDTPWTIGTGTVVYNSTGNYHVDTALEWGTRYYYQAWSNANWTDNSTTYSEFSNNFDSADNTTNSLPQISNPIPVNGSIVDIDTDISIYISDPDGDLFNYSIEVDPQYNLAGEWVGNSTEPAFTQTNGTKTLSINVSHNQTYTWYVNVSDSYDWVNSIYNFTSKVFYVDEPDNGTSHYHETVQYLFLSWNQMERADKYIVVQNNVSYATDAVNGSNNFVRQNSSDNDFNISWASTEGGQFTIFSWNSTSNMYSQNYSDREGLDIPWGAMAINVYNESNSSEGIEFDIEISDSGGVDTYFAYDQTNTLYLDLNDIPFGEDTIFFITADGYESRTSYYDLAENNYYNLNFWLPPYTTPSDPGGGDPGGGDDGEGGNFTTTRQYRLRVIDDYAYPVADATVQIRRYMNATGQYENMSILQTDGYGEADLNLIPSEHYRAHISKDGFDSDIFDWIPDPVFYGANYPKIFQIVGSTEIITTYTFYDLIRFNATLHTNGSLFVNYVDNNANTTDAQFYIYENYNSSRTYIETVSTTSNTHSFWVDNVNHSREHEIIIYLNHTVLGFEVESIIISPVSDAEYGGGGEIERKIEAVFGPFSLGYVQVFFVYLPIMVFLVLPGPKHPGFAIIMASLYAGFASSFIIVGSILAIVPFAIAIGAVLMAVKGGMFKL